MYKMSDGVEGIVEVIVVIGLLILIFVSPMGQFFWKLYIAKEKADYEEGLKMENEEIFSS